MSEEVESNHPAEYQDPPTEEPLLQRACAGAQIRVGHTMFRASYICSPTFYIR